MLNDLVQPSEQLGTYSSSDPNVLRLLMLLTPAICPSLGILANDKPILPNIVVVLADDLGYGDLACYGNTEIKSPNLDRFAAEGLRLTSCYSAAPNCSPARTGLMTGRTPFRVGIYNWIPMLSPMHVRRSEITIATLLRNSGYATCHVGKWHLNGEFNMPSQPQPWDHGFTHWFSTQNNALPNHRNPVNFVRNGAEVGPLEGYAADLVADEAVRWLESQRTTDKPFFMFVCFHEPHEPIASAQRFTKLYPSEDPSYSAHHGNVTQMDDAFGRIVESLERQGLRDETLIIFTSDNGPAITSIHPHGSSGPLRDKKGALYEGGIRVPGIVQWPGRITPGTQSDVPISGVDLLPTLCSVAGVSPPKDRALDGTDISPVFRGHSVERAKPLYWQFNRSRSAPKVAVRDGEWKLVARLTTPMPKPSGEIAEGEMESIKTSELIGFELYNLRTDIAEQLDLIEREPKVAERLRQAMTAMFEEIQSMCPEWPVWEFARYESQRIEWPKYWTDRKKRTNAK